MRRFDEELQTIVDIFNDAWSDNWSFVPMTPAEVRHMGKNLKPILRAEYAWIGEVDGEPAAMTVTLPNINEAIARPGRPPAAVRLGEAALAAQGARHAHARACR